MGYIFAVAGLALLLECPASAAEPQSIDLKFTPPEGLCQVDPARSKAEQQIWTTLPDPQTAQLTHTTFINCPALEQARKGDFSGEPPTNVIFLAELPRTKDQTPPIPDNLEDMIAALVARDTPRYQDAQAFFGHPVESDSALLGSDANGVYYGIRKFDGESREIGGGFSVYTMIGTIPIVIWDLHFDATIDEVKYQDFRELIARMQAENISPVSVDMDDIGNLARKVESCFDIPAGFVSGASQGNAVVSFVIDDDGTLEGTPVIVDQGEGRESDMIGKAAIRALLRCQPYSEFALKGRFHLPFVLR